MTSPESPAVQDTDRLREVAAVVAKARAARWAYIEALGPVELANYVHLQAHDENLLADLAAVLPVHREMVLAEAADALTDAGNDPLRNAAWMYADEAAGLVRRLAVSAPPTPPGSQPADERATAVETGTAWSVAAAAVAESAREIEARRTALADREGDEGYDPFVADEHFTEAPSVITASWMEVSWAEASAIAAEELRQMEARRVAADRDAAAVPGTGDDPPPPWTATAWRDRDDITWTWEDGRWYIQDDYVDVTCGPHYDLDDLREHHGPNMTPLDVDNVSALLAEHAKLRDDLLWLTTERERLTAERDSAIRELAEKVDLGAWEDLAAERDRLALDLQARDIAVREADRLRVQAVLALGEVRGREARLVAERDDARESAASILNDAGELAETIRRYEPVLEAARALLDRVAETEVVQNGYPELAGKAADVAERLAALGDIPSPTAPEAAPLETRIEWGVRWRGFEKGTVPYDKGEAYARYVFGLYAKDGPYADPENTIDLLSRTIRTWDGDEQHIGRWAVVEAWPAPAEPEGAPDA